MKLPVSLCAVVLLLVGCTDDASTPRAAPTSTTTPAVSRSPSPSPSAAGSLTITEIGRQPLPGRVQGIALLGRKVAYVDSGRRLVLLDWRSGTRHVVRRTTHGLLFMLEPVGRFVTVVDSLPGVAGDDPSTPHEYFSLDLATGRTRTVDRPDYASRVVGEFDALQLRLVRDYRPQEVNRGDLVRTFQGPGLEQPPQPLTTNGLVSQAAMQHMGLRVVWTQRAGHRQSDPATVWTTDLTHPDEAPVQLADPDGAPNSPFIGTGFVGWAEDGVRLRVMSPDGGAVTPVRGPFVCCVDPAADRHWLAAVRREHGRNELVVLEVHS